MKHTLKITIFLLILFFLAQIIGLLTITQYIQVEKLDDGTIEIIHPDTVAGEQPDIPEEQKSYNFIVLTIAILVGTGLLFLIIKFKLGWLWKFWFFLAITISLALSFEVYVNSIIALILAAILSIIRIKKPNVVVHNLTEVFIYTGITILVLPLLNLFAGFLLLILISIYDMIAVWKSKHMIKLAKFQMRSKLFAGLSLNYNENQEISDKKPKKGKVANAILGGGDIAFPLFFSAAVIEHLILSEGLTKISALLMSFWTTLGAGIGLALLLIFSKKQKFYPAMPFISAGCFFGYLIIFLF